MISILPFLKMPVCRVASTLVLLFCAMSVSMSNVPTLRAQHHAQVASKPHAMHAEAHSKAHTKVSPCIQEGVATKFTPENIISEKVPCPGNSMGIEAEPHVDPKELMSKAAYPSSIKTAKKEAWVSLLVLVDEKGKYDRHILECIKAYNPKKNKWDAELAIEDIEALEASAVTALKNVTFTPAQKAGKPLHCWTMIPFHYQGQ
jgi:hypothetical protein